MKLAYRKARLVAHLLYGMGVVATRFSKTDDAGRRELNRAWSIRMLALCGMKLVVHHDENRIDHGALVVSNHISWIDIYVINAWRPTPFVSKAEVRQWPIVGWCAEQLGTIFLQREKRSDAKRIMHELSDRLRSGQLMCVFPEGTTGDGATLLPFHSNMFQAAVSAACAVQPLCIYYADEQGRQSLAPAYIGDMSLGECLTTMLKAGKLTAHVYVGKPILPGDDRRTLAATAQRIVADALADMRGDGVADTVSQEVPMRGDGVQTSSPLIDAAAQQGRSA